ncbi:two-component system cell cycle response regulator DivK [Brevundimonas bullata]|uniref:Two-component system cell cycle response regulator DivK n=3 Tax=Brevundimonas TaxID=41275 RepID=A0A7W7N5I3_9CAUL|nr:two-component system cell cycle response regulator DivK [Brevundimonas bullata]MBB6384532.1 two-component system cell cycle response regulator DivK [Brevundimonas bullata]
MRHSASEEGEKPCAMARFVGETAGWRMSKKVLIVEDNELNMKLFHDLLDSQGYETLQTREGLQALAIARQHRPDLILMDIQLPEISGLEVTKWLKDDEELNHIPVIAVTAFAMKGDEERIRQGGCEAYISKPISVVSFLETIRKHLG